MTPREGTRVLVVGASGGLGLEVLRSLLALPLTVGAHCRSARAPLERTLARPRVAAAEIFEADLTGAAASRELVSSFVAWAGGIDALIQLSGDLSRPVPWSELTEEDWDRDLAVNLKAPFFLAQAAMREMRGAGGRIVLTGTASARHGGGPTSVAYGAAKAGIEFLAKALARVGAPDGILVNAVCPGFIDTPFHAERARRTPEELAGRAQQIPLRRAGTPAEVAALVLFLVSDEASYITGECISVSGGDWL